MPPSPDHHTHDSSNPPAPSGGPPSQADTTGAWAVEKARKASGAAAEALDAATESLDIARELKNAFGLAPNPVLGLPGSGICGAFAILSGKVDGLGTKFDGLVTELAVDRAARASAETARVLAEARRAGAILWAAKIVGAALLVAAVGAVLAFLSGFHR